MINSQLYARRCEFCFMLYRYSFTNITLKALEQTGYAPPKIISTLLCVCMYGCLYVIKKFFFLAQITSQTNYIICLIGLFNLQFTAFVYLTMYLGFVLVFRGPVVGVGLFCRFWHSEFC